MLLSIQCGKSLDEGYGIDVLYLDYRKAFDSVSHLRLLQKLKLYGIDGDLWVWLRNFLTGRRMKVGVQGTFSTWTDVLSGIPQGSILGPLLFLLFVNELPHWILNNMKMFADDTKLWTRIKTAQDGLSLQADLDNLSTWSEIWQLRFNPDKCKIMHIGHSIDTKYYMMDGVNRVEVKAVVEERDLGVHCMKDLKPSRQCTKSASKARSVMAMVKRHFRRLDIQGFRIIYK